MKDQHTLEKDHQTLEKDHQILKKRALQKQNGAPAKGVAVDEKKLQKHHSAVVMLEEGMEMEGPKVKTPKKLKAKAKKMKAKIKTAKAKMKKIVKKGKKAKKA